MNKNPKMLLATAATANYVPHAKQLFASAHEAGYWQGQYMLLAYGLSAEDRYWFESRGVLVREYDYIMGEEEWNALPCSNFHRIVLERYHLFREEFKQWDVIVYMDCDIIVQGPLVRLAHMRGFGATLCAARYVSINVLRDYWPDFQEKYGYDLKQAGFNSGVMAFSTDIITPSLYEEMLALHKRFAYLGYCPDQLTLNLYFYKKWQRLSMSYGFLASLVPSMIFSNASRAIALHFAFHKRPWNPKSPYYPLWQSNLLRAEQIDFSVPRPINRRIWLQARMREMGFIPWFVYLRSAFNMRFESKSWYPHLRKLLKGAEY